MDVWSSSYFLRGKTDTVKIGIKIDEIVKDSHISGQVTGLDADSVEKYKVLVFVRTDQWYLHPYASGGEGLSWARVKPDGTWRISTVLRGFASSAVAAVLVFRQHPQESRLRSLETSSGVATIILSLRETPHYGKL